MKYLKKNFFLFLIIFLLLLLLVIISVFGFDSLVYFFTKFINYTALASIASIGGLIITIFMNRKEVYKLIKSEIDSSNQIEFERRLYEILSYYDQIIEEMSYLNIDFGKISSDSNEFIKASCIKEWNLNSIKFTQKICTMREKIIFFYRFDENNDKVKFLLSTIDSINTALLVEFSHYSVLCTKATNINAQNNLISMENNSEKKQLIFKRISDDTSDLINDMSNISKNVSRIINDKKTILYKCAIDCINERSNILKTYDNYSN